MTMQDRRDFVKTLLAAPLFANFDMRAGERDPYAGKKLSPEEDARETAMVVRAATNQLVSQFPDVVATVVEQLVLRIRELEDR